MLASICIPGYARAYGVPHKAVAKVIAIKVGGLGSCFQFFDG